MRLWSIHPSYLDPKGLVSAWREALLAKAVLSGRTKGYRNHPQLIRFKKHPTPVPAINSYLGALYKEALARGYHFKRRKCGLSFADEKIPVTKDQLKYELRHLINKVLLRNKKWFCRICNARTSLPHPLFKVCNGKIETWEKLRR